MKPELAMWINRAGLFLDFLAFWFAAPELLGEKRLRSVEAAVERSMNLLLGLISAITWGVTLLIFILPVFIAGRTLLVPALSGLLLTVNSFFMVYWGLRNNVFRDRKKNLAKDKSFIFFSIVTIGLLIFVVVWEINAKEKVWLVVVLVFGPQFIALVIALTIRPVSTMLERLLKLMSDDESIRRRSLIVGASMFMTGFALQLAATF